MKCLQYIHFMGIYLSNIDYICRKITNYDSFYCHTYISVIIGDVACILFLNARLMRIHMMQEEKIEYLIRSLGIGSTYRGYRYLNYGVQLCLKNEDYLLSVSKLLYPQIAKHYNASCYSVERDIRTVVKVCWDRGNKQLLQEIALRPLCSRPPSGEFLDILTAHLRNTPTTSV